MSVCSFMQIPNMVHIAIQKMIQATGNMVAPMCFQIAGVIVNFVFDPILIFGIGVFRIWASAALRWLLLRAIHYP